MGFSKKDNIEDHLPLKVIKTEGDMITDRRLIEAGGKALFTKAIDEALLDHQADMAVHSFKDVPAWLPDGLSLSCMPRREDVRDALISNKYHDFETLRKGAIIGTASLRRKAQLLRARPDLEIRLLRGNIDTRISKLDNGDYDAVVLAAAGLHRLGLKSRITQYLDTERFLPAATQGSLSIQCREGEIIDCLQSLDHKETRFQVMAERGVMQSLEASCRSAVAAYALIKDQTIDLVAEVLGVSGQKTWRQSRQFNMTTPEQAFLEGVALGEAIKTEAGGSLIWSDLDD
jgi:hydroxymethylbilane synthase